MSGMMKEARVSKCAWQDDGTFLCTEVPTCPFANQYKARAEKAEAMVERLEAEVERLRDRVGELELEVEASYEAGYAQGASEAEGGSE